MSTHEFFDVLSISDENGNVDMIQALMGNDCLGTYFKNGTAKLYFQGGLKNNLEEQLQKITDSHISEMDVLGLTKEKEVMEV